MTNGDKNMTNKREQASMPQPQPRKRPGVHRTSVLMPKELRKKVERAARGERRGVSPMIVVLVERGLQAMETASG